MVNTVFLPCDRVESGMFRLGFTSTFVICDLRHPIALCGSPRTSEGLHIALRSGAPRLDKIPLYGIRDSSCTVSVTEPD